MVPRSSDRKFIKYHLKGRTRAKKDRANKAKRDIKAKDCMGNVVCPLEYRNKDEKCFKNCGKFVSHKEILCYFCGSYIKNKTKQSPFRDLHCKTEELILLQ